MSISNKNLALLTAKYISYLYHTRSKFFRHIDILTGLSLFDLTPRLVRVSEILGRYIQFDFQDSIPGSVMYVLKEKKETSQKATVMY